jgi:hypothetical protein
VPSAQIVVESDLQRIARGRIDRGQLLRVASESATFFAVPFGIASAARQSHGTSLAAVRDAQVIARGRMAGSRP